MVGSTTSDFMWGALHESGFSNSGPNVKAVGEEVTIDCPGQTLGNPGIDCIDMEGTSLSAPQAAGLATLLWLMSPTLRDFEAANTLEAIRANTRDNDHCTDIIDAYAAVLSLDHASVPDANTARVGHAILNVNGDTGDTVFDELDIQQYMDHYFVNGSPVSPEERDFSRFDLNGDGFTGGSKTERFDLDRVGSIQFGETIYSPVSQDIAGVRVDFDEWNLTDTEILCYYAYSSLYQGNPDRRDELLVGVCIPTATASPTTPPMAITATPTETLSATPSATRGPCALTNHSICKRIQRYGAGEGDNTVVPIVFSACGGQVEQRIVSLDPVLTISRDGITFGNIIPEQNPVGASPLGSHTAILTFVDPEHPEETLTLTFTFTMEEDPIRHQTWGGRTSISGDCTQTPP